MSGKIAIRVDERDNLAEEATLSRGPLTSRRGRIVEVNTEKIRQNIAALTHEVADFLRDVRQVGKFELNEVQLAVEIGASGGVNLVGSLTAEASGAITLTFRPTAKETQEKSDPTMPDRK